MTSTGSGEPARRGTDYYPVWLDNLADDVTLEGSAMDGVLQGAEAVRTALVYIRSLYDYQEFNYVGPYGDHDFVEDYTSVVRGEPIGSWASIFAGTEFARYFPSPEAAEALAHDAVSVDRG